METLIENFHLPKVPSRYANTPEAYLAGYVDCKLYYMLRDYKSGLASQVDTRQQIEYLPNKNVVRLGSREIQLTEIEDKLMHYFWNNRNGVCTHKKILKILYVKDDRSDVEDGSSYERTLVSTLRRKIDPDNPNKYIITVKGIGYRLINTK